jgi:hypothetical protein
LFVVVDDGLPRRNLRAINQEGLVVFIDGTDPKEMLRIVRSHGHAGVGAWSSRSRLNKGTFEL